MNAFAPITDKSTSNMTSKGQVLIPKAIRDRLGLSPGPVEIGINDRGEAVVRPAVDTSNETAEQRKVRMLAAIDAIAGRYAIGQSTDDHMADIRGPYDDLP